MADYIHYLRGKPYGHATRQPLSRNAYHLVLKLTACWGVLSISIRAYLQTTARNWSPVASLNTGYCSISANLHSSSLRFCCVADQSISTSRQFQSITTSVAAQQAEAVPTPKACSKAPIFDRLEKKKPSTDLCAGRYADLPAPRPRPPLDHLRDEIELNHRAALYFVERQPVPRVITRQRKLVLLRSISEARKPVDVRQR